MKKHTAGPWELIDDDFIYALNAECHNTFTVSVSGGCKCSKCGLINNEDEVQANAHLIAAAPELLEALENFVIEYDVSMKSNREPQYVSESRAAIKKAKGEQNK